MKLRNKKTGEIVDLFEIVRLNDVSNEFYLRLTDNEGRTYKVGFNSLAELNEEWEDYEEPKKYWRITDLGELKSIRLNQHHQNIEKCKEIGNYFETEEEAERAVEKLKAWKRLKDKGFELDAVTDTFFCLDIFMKGEPYEAIKDDLKIVFGGEE